MKKALFIILLFSSITIEAQDTIKRRLNNIKPFGISIITSEYNKTSPPYQNYGRVSIPYFQPNIGLCVDYLFKLSASSGILVESTHSHSFSRFIVESYSIGSKYPFTYTPTSNPNYTYQAEGHITTYSQFAIKEHIINQTLGVSYLRVKDIVDSRFSWVGSAGAVLTFNVFRKYSESGFYITDSVDQRRVHIRSGDINWSYKSGLFNGSAYTEYLFLKVETGLIRKNVNTNYFLTVGINYRLNSFYYYYQMRAQPYLKLGIRL